jgi:alpha-L-rhamnosidase
VLTQIENLDVAYRLLRQDTYPSWGYAIKKGATTMWERWDGITEKGEIRGSLNHYAFGAVGEWLYETIGGIAPAAPGYKEILIRPRPGGGLTWAKAELDSVYGKIASEWKIENEKFHLKVRIPVNTTATVVLPDGAVHQVGSGEHEF